MTECAALWTPFKIGKLECKNRICMAPMMPGGWLDESKNLTDRVIRYYEERARGGVGLIYAGASFPDAKLEIADFTTSPFAKPELFIQQTGKLVDAVHKYDCRVFMQIQLGCGRVAAPMILKDPPVAPSAVPNVFDPNIRCRELTTKEVYQLIDAVVDGAVLCQQAGADGVDINGVNSGYLGDQFATERFNHRTDEFGGSLENRARLLTEIVRRIKEKCGSDFPVTTRLGTKSHISSPGVGHLPGDPYEEYGRDMSESLALGRILEQAGFDGILFGTGSYEAMYWIFPPRYMADGAYLEEIRQLKSVLHIPIISPGKLADPHLAEQAIRDGVIDAVALGRASLADPHWANKVKAGRYEDIRPCRWCNDGCIARGLGGKDVQCAVNPDLFHEGEMAAKYAKADHPKKVAVIGAGLAGMEAARVAAIRGHQVTLYEQGDQIGGRLLASAVPGFQDADRKLLAWYEHALRDSGVKICLNQKLDLQQILALDAEALVMAVGGTPRRPALPDTKGVTMLSCEDALRGRKPLGRQILLMGGDLIACETALWLHEQGLAATIVCAAEELLGEDVIPVPQGNRDMLLGLLKRAQFPVYTKAEVTALTSEGAQIEADGHRVRIPCDMILYSLHQDPDRSLFQSVYENTDKPVWLAGDASAPGSILTAVRDGSAIGAVI